MKKEVWLKYRCSSRVTCSQACRAAGKGRPLGTFKRVNQLVQGPLTSAWWLWCWGQLIPSTSIQCPEVLSDCPLFNQVHTPDWVCQDSYLAILYVFLRFAHFYLPFTPANSATPECTWYFPPNVPCLCLVSFAGPVPSCFSLFQLSLRTILFWQAFSSENGLFPPIFLFVSCALVVPFYALIPFGLGYITITPFSI